MPSFENIYVHTIHSVIFLQFSGGRCQCLIECRDARLCFSHTNNLLNGILTRQLDDPTKLEFCSQFPLITLHCQYGDRLPNDSRWSGEWYCMLSR